jgi:hypothetical protein
VVLTSCFVPVVVAVGVAVADVVAVTRCDSFVVHYVDIVMSLYWANYVVHLSCLPSLRFEKKKIHIFYQGFSIVGFLL